MKTTPILLCASVLLMAACQKNSGSASSGPVETCVVKDGTLLLTQLPPEQLEGTPPPILLSGLLASPAPPQQLQGPGTLGVRYGLIKETP